MHPRRNAVWCVTTVLSHHEHIRRNPCAKHLSTKSPSLAHSAGLRHIVEEGYEYVILNRGITNCIGAAKQATTTCLHLQILKDQQSLAMAFAEGLHRPVSLGEEGEGMSCNLVFDIGGRDGQCACLHHNMINLAFIVSGMVLGGQAIKWAFLGQQTNE